VAIYHYAVHKVISRGAGKSAVASAAYMCRERYRDERTGQTYDYRSEIDRAAAYIDRSEGFEEGRKAALFTGLYGPAGAPEWTRGREHIGEFWNRLEQFEKHERAQIAVPIDIALPHELTLDQNRTLIQDHIRERFVRKGFVVQLAIHEPEHGEARNIHAHLLVSTRQVDKHGFVASKEQSRQNFLHRSEYVQDLREHWEHVANRHLARHGHDIQIDSRTLKAQGIARAPTRHLGPERIARPHEIVRLERAVAAIDRAARQREAQQARPFEPPADPSFPREERPAQRFAFARLRQPIQQPPEHDATPRSIEPAAPPEIAPARDPERAAAEEVQPLRQHGAERHEPQPGAPEGERVAEREQEADPPKVAAQSERDHKLDRLRGLSDDELRREAHGDQNQNKDIQGARSLTALDIAKTIAPGYDEELRRAAEWRAAAKSSDEQRWRHESEKVRHERVYQQRCDKIGPGRCWAHDKGWWRDGWLDQLGAARDRAAAAAKRSAELAEHQRHDAALHERRAAVAVEASMELAGAMLAGLKERAALAKEVLDERRAPFRALTAAELSQEIARGGETHEAVMRRLSPAYAQASDRISELEAERRLHIRGLEWAESEAKQADEKLTRRWQEMNRGLGLRAWTHYLGSEKFGFERLKDPDFAKQESAWQAAQQRIAALTAEANKIDQALPLAQQTAERERVRITPAAEQEYAKQQERAGLAREVQGERQERARQQQRAAEQRRQIERARAIARAERAWSQRREQALERERAAIRQDRAAHPERARARGLGDDALWREAHLDHTGRKSLEIADVARELSPTLAGAEKAIAGLRERAEAIERERNDLQWRRSLYHQDHTTRRQDIGMVRRWVHDSGLSPDDALSRHAGQYNAAQEAITTLDREQAQIAAQIKAHERTAREAFEQVRLAGERELSIRRERADLAQAVQEERAVERERLHEVELTMERDRERYGLEPRYGLALEHGKGLRPERDRERDDWGWER
jgi:hypothetical protein